MSRTGPVTRDTSAVPLGLAQIRIGSSQRHITEDKAVLSSNNSLGALGQTKLTSNVDYWKLESGFPLLEDMTLPIREQGMMEVTFKEVTPFNVALARGLDPTASYAAFIALLAATGNRSAITKSVLAGASVTTLGTTSGNIGASDTGGVADVWTITFIDGTSASVEGATTGALANITDLSAVYEPANPDVPGGLFFSIPANFFTGTWDTDETYVFETKTTNAAVVVAPEDTSVLDEFTLTFTGPTGGTAAGKRAGDLGAFTVASEFAPTDASSNKYFTIAADALTGTFEAGDTVTFTTIPKYTAPADYSDNHKGSISLGTLKAPEFVRMESIYVYPDGEHRMIAIFPRANITSSLEVDYQAEDAAAPPMTIEAKRADSETSGGHTVWDSQPLGLIYFE